MKYISQICESSFNILAHYYNFRLSFAFHDFILPASQKEQNSKVLFEETEKEFFIGIQFEKQIFDEINFIENKTSQSKTKYISLNTAAVIAEEISHFKLILDGFENNKRISLVDLETLGEIDRFLCLMHWNEKNKIIKICHNWKNIHDICDHLFLGNRFKYTNNCLYEKAECNAFLHLKNAFKNEWDSTRYNFSKINLFAAQYFQKLRSRIQF